MFDKFTLFFLNPEVRRLNSPNFHCENVNRVCASVLPSKVRVCEVSGGDYGTSIAEKWPKSL